MCVLAPGLSLSIILTLLSMCGTKIKSGRAQVPMIHVDVCMRTTQSQLSRLIYNVRLHIPCSYFTFSLGFFHCLFHAEAANRKQTVTIATRGTTGIRM